jgi:CRISPR-associated protein Cas1
LLWLRRGHLAVEAGTLHFLTVAQDEMPAGNYAIPFQGVSCILLQPGTTVSHDALRLLARHGTGLVAVGEGGTRIYASMPFGAHGSARARQQVAAWADPGKRIEIARKMYFWRLGEHLPTTDLNSLRGIEGARMKESYKAVAQQFGVPWAGRRYDRQHPEKTDLVNMAINHASVAGEAAAMVAVAVTGALPQLGFIHEDSELSFALDISDLFRAEVLLPIAFAAVREARDLESLERVTRKLAASTFRKHQIVARMIDRIKELFDADDGRDHEPGA